MLKTNKKLLNLAVAGALAAVATSSWGAMLTTPGVFGGGDGLITFEEISIPSGTSITTQYSAYGASFSPNLVMENGVRGGTGGFSSPQNLANFSPTVNPFDIIFNAVTTAAGAFWEFDVGNVATFTAKLGASVVDSFAYTEGSCCSSGTFLGFNNVTFDNISVSITGSQLMIMDNLHFRSSVPEPAGLALLGLGLAGLGWSRRKTA